MPALFERFFDSLYMMPLIEIIIWSALENLIVFTVCLITGHFLIKRYQQYPITEPPDPISRTELALAASCVLLNTAVTIIGIELWQEGIIRVNMSMNLLRILIDSIVLFFIMDLAMYIFHRVAHHPWLYPIIHSTHHRFENPRPLTLFVLNPFETLGFGMLLILAFMIYPGNWLAIILYLTLNVVFGLVGHVGVEPMPNAWIKLPLINYISTSTFHAEHHLDKDHNYGFYTLIWDRLFGTISPAYRQDFENARGQNVNP